MKKFINLIFYFSLIIFFTNNSNAQNTVGLVDAVYDEVSEGYNLFYPLFNNTVYLTDNCGRVVNTWQDSGFTPGSAFELLPNGNLIKTKSYGFNSPSDIIFAGGAGDILAIKDWENNLVWEYAINNDTARMHHDFEVLPNGNILLMVWQKVGIAQLAELGRNIITGVPNTGSISSDFIIEIETVGANDVNVVWQWNVLDHIIQDFDSTKANYGNVSANPQKVDFNYFANFAQAQVNWLNSNSIDYNPVLDHILYSVPGFNEVWIIDHSTTTQEAASSEGGNSNKGGDLLFRWGNNNAIGANGVPKLGFQHTPNYINPDAQIGDADFNKIVVFNNRAGADFSSVNIFQPVWDAASNQYISTQPGIYEPADFEFTFTADPPQTIYSNILSNAQFLENGNLLICSGIQSTVWEFNTNNDLVWQYINPLGNNGVKITQGDTDFNSSQMFRFLRYNTSYAAFNGKDLTAGDYIELNGNNDVCNILYSNIDNQFYDQISLYPNPASDFIVLQNLEPNTTISIYDILGNKLIEQKSNNTSLIIDTKKLKSGFYTVSINGKATKKLLID